MCSHSLLAKRIITFAFFKGNTDEELVGKCGLGCFLCAHCFLLGLMVQDSLRSRTSKLKKVKIRTEATQQE